MQEINRTIRELWEQTYTGGDIDYIEIVSADEDDKKSKKEVDHSKRKSYSYSVMMWKGHTKVRTNLQCNDQYEPTLRLNLADALSWPV